MTLTTLALLVAVLVAASLAPAAQAQSRSKKVCSRTATVRDTPRGFVIARLSRGQKVVVAARSGTKGWIPVRTSGGVPGWILTRSLCK
jgi:uncharacterized protein YgiM (DUF1202 family)